MRFDLLVEEIDAIRQGAAHRKEVDESAANAVFAWRHHLRHVRVAGERQLRRSSCACELLALLEEEGVCGEILDRRRRR